MSLSSSFSGHRRIGLRRSNPLKLFGVITGFRGRDLFFGRNRGLVNLMSRFALLLLMATAVNAQEVDRLFGGGLFGTEWDSSLNDVVAVHPDGETESIDESVTYTIEDDRTIFEIERTVRDIISFQLMDNQLVRVSATFPDCDVLTTRLFELLGAATGPRTPTAIGSWVGDGISVSVLLPTRFEDCMLVVGREPLSGHASPEELGLE